MFYFFFILNIFYVNSEKVNNTTRFDSSECKLTHFGTEYVGFKSTTAGGVRCQAWNSRYPLHKIDSSIKDDDFPEMSMRQAKNYCRNPTKNSKGPWCYTMDSSLITDECGIPLCNYGGLKINQLKINLPAFLFIEINFFQNVV
ncbi:prothrombin-like [Leptopilina boulardi]|uniref:prothrombin-like n=1 Tax=Leptopilina boulardi TaxID=63433 RepID=UPI0021F6175E|nr:prothrombin-like [Leptopilina boulardi]